MTSASRAPQCGHFGSERGSGFFRLGGKPLLLEAAEHGEGALIDGTCATASSDRIPLSPVDLHLGGFGLEAFLQPCAQLLGTQAQAAVFMQLGGLAIRRAEPLDSFAPSKVQRLGADAGLEPAASVE